METVGEAGRPRTAPGLDAGALFAALREAGFVHFSGVPCSLLDPLMREASRAGAYLPAHVEGEAVALAAGAWLAGSAGAVLLQNSGLGNTVNPLASLLLPYRIPALFVVSWRGQPGRPDARHHAEMGAATLPLLELFGVEAQVLGEGADPAALVPGLKAALEARRPAALVVPRGLFARAPGAAAAVAGGAEPGVQERFEGGPLPTRAEVVAACLEDAGGGAVLSTTGFVSRELARHGPRPEHFYMQGSMGYVLALALGVGRVQPRRPLLVLDGDGALLMRLGSLATAAALRLPGLLHVVIDNGTYGSTGAQPLAARVDFAAAALACGYAQAALVRGRAALGPGLAWARARRGTGPTLLQVPIVSAEEAAGERPEPPPEEIAARFRAVLTEGAAP